jgi:hypothetical protein
MDLFLSSQSQVSYFDDWKMVTTIVILARQSTWVTQYPITMTGKSLSEHHFPAKRLSFLRKTICGFIQAVVHIEKHRPNDQLI